MFKFAYTFNTVKLTVKNKIEEINFIYSILNTKINNYGTNYATNYKYTNIWCT
jgi:hypothetical protein